MNKQPEQLNELALFAGAGGGILGGHLLGWRTVCAVEFAAYPRSVLLARQRDGMLPKFPVWDDVRTFNGKPWRGHVDVISGGFPCQDISVAGRGDGLDGERSGLWSEMARIIGEVQPRFAFVENSPMLTSRGLDRVLGDLSTLGYDAQFGVVSAADAGAPHRRERIWILAHTNVSRLQEHELFNADLPIGSGDAEAKEACSITRQHPIRQLAGPNVFGCLHGQAEERSAEGGIHAQREPEPSGEDVAHAAVLRLERAEQFRVNKPERERPFNEGWWRTEPGFCGVVNALAPQLDKP